MFFIVMSAYSAGAAGASAAGAAASAGAAAAGVALAAGAALSAAVLLNALAPWVGAAAALASTLGWVDNLGRVYALPTESTNISAASVHVVFSKKVLVPRTPSTWLPAPNCDDKPPPLDFWMSTMPISKIATITTRTINTMYILCRLLLFYYLYITQSTRFRKVTRPSPRLLVRAATG